MSFAGSAPLPLQTTKAGHLRKREDLARDLMTIARIQGLERPTPKAVALPTWGELVQATEDEATRIACAQVLASDFERDEGE